MKKTYSFLGTGGTVTAAGGDITLANHIVSIAGTGAPKNIDYRKIVSAQLYGFLIEALQIRTIDPVGGGAVVVGTTYQLQIQQYIPEAGGYVETPLYYTAVTGDTATIIANAWRAQLALASPNKITGSGTATLILTAQTGYPTFTVNIITPGGLITQANSMPSVAIVSSTNATPIVVTTAAGTFAVGDSVTVAGHATNTNANGNWRVSATNGTTTVTLEGSVGNGVGGATGTVQDLAQKAASTYAQLTAAGIIGGAVGQNYSALTILYELFNQETAGETRREQYLHTVYINVAATNYAALVTRINEILGATNVGSTTVATPETVAIADPV